MIAGLIRLARPRDWIKNVFVLLPVPFAMKAMDIAGKRSLRRFRFFSPS